MKNSQNNASKIISSALSAIALLLSLGLMSSLVGCGAGNPEAGEQEDGGTTTEQPAGEQEDDAAEEQEEGAESKEGGEEGEDD